MSTPALTRTELRQWVDETRDPRSSACPGRLRLYTTQFRGLAADTTEQGTPRNQTFNTGGLVVGIVCAARIVGSESAVNMSRIGIGIQRQSETGLTIPIMMASLFSTNVDDPLWMSRFGFIVSDNSTLIVRAYHVYSASELDIDVTFALDQIGWPSQ